MKQFLIILSIFLSSSLFLTSCSDSDNDDDSDNWTESSKEDDENIQNLPRESDTKTQAS